MKIPSLDLLPTLVAVAESPSLVEAAQRLGISQPAVSAHLARLEAAAPYPVFSFQGKRKVLTRFGQSLYESARESLARLDDRLEKTIQGYARPEDLTLRLGCRREIFHVVAKKFRFPGKLEFSALSNHRAVTRLLDRSLDIAVSYERPEAPGILARKIFAYGSKLVVHRKWADGSVFGLAQARSKAFLERVPSLAYRREAPLLREWLRAQGIDPDRVEPRVLCEDWRLLMDLVENGAGYAVVPAHTDSNSPDVLSVALPASILPEVPYYALFHQDLRKIPGFRHLLAQAER